MSSFCAECIRIFRNLSKEEIIDISSCVRKDKYRKGEITFTPFEDFENLYALIRGEVIIY